MGIFGGLQKWTFNGSTWTKQFTISTLALRGLTGRVDGSGNVTLFATSTFGTSGANQLLGFTDTLANTSSGSTTQVTLATAAANVQFRGIVYVPEPGSAALLFAGGVVLLGVRVRRRPA